MNRVSSMCTWHPQSLMSAFSRFVHSFNTLSLRFPCVCFPINFFALRVFFGAEKVLHSKRGKGVGNGCPSGHSKLNPMCMVLGAPPGHLMFSGSRSVPNSEEHGASAAAPKQKRTTRPILTRGAHAFFCFFEPLVGRLNPPIRRWCYAARFPPIGFVARHWWGGVRGTLFAPFACSFDSTLLTGRR